jgi:hypothetical protein
MVVTASSERVRDKPTPTRRALSTPRMGQGGTVGP